MFCRHGFWVESLRSHGLLDTKYGPLLKVKINVAIIDGYMYYKTFYILKYFIIKMKMLILSFIKSSFNKNVQ